MVKDIARAAALAALFLASTVLAACGKQTFLAAALLGTPAVPNPVSPANPIPAQTLALAYLGTIDTSNPTKIDSSSVGTVPGAKGDLAFHSAAKNMDFDLTDVKDNGDGSYTLDSATDANLTYEAGQQYTLVLIGGDHGDAFGAKLLPAPPTTIKEFPASKFLTASAGADFTVTRTDGPDSDGNLLPAFVAVMKVDPQNPTNVSLSNLTYSTLPQDATALLKFALSDVDYRKPSFVIPGSNFVSGSYYVVALFAIKYGLVSENTFLGSTALSGTGDAGLLQIQ